LYRFQLNFTNDKDHGVLFVGGPRERTTPSRCRI